MRKQRTEQGATPADGIGARTTERVSSILDFNTNDEVTFSATAPSADGLVFVRQPRFTCRIVADRWHAVARRAAG